MAAAIRVNSSGSRLRGIVRSNGGSSWCLRSRLICCGIALLQIAYESTSMRVEQGRQPLQHAGGQFDLIT